MTAEEFERRKEGAVKETFVISRMAEGFRVYSPASPKKMYIVAMSPDGSRCSCPGFRDNGEDPNWQCDHIAAVEDQLAKQQGRTAGNGTGQTEKPDQSGQSRREDSMDGNGKSQVVIKRSVSPDGRIDSLSVEVAFPVESLSVKDIKSRAETAQKLQAEIVNGFLSLRREGGEEQTSGNGESPKGNGNGAIPAQIIGVGGKDGQWGRRLFLTVRTEERNLRLYGNRKQLADHLKAAAAAVPENQIAEGLKLDLPCLIVTRASDDSGFVTVERVLPAERGNGR